MQDISSAVVPSDQVPAVLGNYDFSHMHRLVNGAFTNTAAGQQVLVAAGSAHTAGTAHIAGSAHAPSPAQSSGAGVMTHAADVSPQKLSESAILQRGELHMRAFFDRAMLGPPLPEPGAGPAEPLPHSEAMLKQPLPEHGAQAERGTPPFCSFLLLALSTVDSQYDTSVVVCQAFGLTVSRRGPGLNT